MYPRDVFVRYGGLHRTEAAEVVLCQNIAVCLISVVVESGEFSVSKAKLFPTQTNTTDYKLRPPPTPAQHFTIQHTTHHKRSLDIFPSNQGAGYSCVRSCVR